MEKQLYREIEKIIVNYLDDTSITSPDKNESLSLSEALEQLDSDFSSFDLAQQIAEHVVRKFIPKFAVQFEETANPLGNGSLACDKCYRPYGEWVSPSTRVAAESVAKPGSKVILLG